MEGLYLATQGLAVLGPYAMGFIVLAVLAGAIRVGYLYTGESRTGRSLLAEESKVHRAA